MRKAVKMVVASALAVSMVVGNTAMPIVMAAQEKTTFPDEYPDWALIPMSGTELEKTVHALVVTMTQEEKFSILGGNGTGSEGNAGYLKGIPRLGVPESRMYDGPAGVLSLYETTNPPQEQMLASTWNPGLAYLFGEIHGAENKAISGNIQLGSQFDITRSPYFGRAKDQMGEDPYLLSSLAIPVVQGIQDQNVVAVGKHYAAFSIDASPATKTNVIVSEQALHEVHLPGFEAAVTKGGMVGMMSAYNLINGVYASANSYLQNAVLRGMWGYTGFTVTDWGGNSGNTISKGTDIEMPSLSGNNRSSSEALIASGKLTQADVDSAAAHVLTALGKVGYLGLVEIDTNGKAKEESGRTKPIKLREDLDILEEVTEKSNESSLEIAEKGGVLLKNHENTLPLHEDQQVAVIGLNGMYLKSGVDGERSFGTISQMTSPFEALRDILGDDHVRGEVAMDKVGEIIPAEYLYTSATPSTAKKATMSMATKATTSMATKATTSTATKVKPPTADKGSSSPNSTATPSEPKNLDSGGSNSEKATSSEASRLVATSISKNLINLLASGYSLLKNEAFVPALPINQMAIRQLSIMSLNREDEIFTSDEADESEIAEEEYGVKRTYGVAKSSGSTSNQQGQMQNSGTLEETAMKGYEIGEDAGVDSQINFTTGTIDGKPNKTYIGKNADEGTDTSLKKADGAAYTWTTYLEAPETGTYSIILGGIGGGIAAAMEADESTDGIKRKTVSFGIASVNQGAQWGSDIPGETGTILSSQVVHLTKGKRYKVVVAGIAKLTQKDLQVTLSWITPSKAKENYANALKAAEESDVSVVFAYNKGSSLASTREASTLRLPAEQEQLILDVAAQAHENGHKVAVVLNNSTAVTMGNWLDEVDAVLEMYYPGQRGGVATARLLTGEVNPSGKLAFTIPKKDTDTLDNYTQEIFNRQKLSENGFNSVHYSEGILTGYKWYDANDVEPQFDFGFGLSYTEFKYSDLKVKKNNQDGEKAGFDVTFTVENVGDMKGSEIAQVYLGEAVVPEGIQMAPYALAGYERIEDLEPGEARTVTVHVNERSLSYWNTNGKLETQSDGTIGKWTLATGERTVYVGAASDNLILQDNITVKQSDAGNGNNSTSGGSSDRSSSTYSTASGTWKQDAKGWWYRYSDGTYPVSKWQKINNEWYYFNENGYAAVGWQLINGKWYYLDETNCNMQIGWMKSPADNRWYYLGSDGDMQTGWLEVDGKWYYLNPVSENVTYSYDALSGRWVYIENTAIPYGAMYENTKIPDGYRVNADGFRVE